MDVAAVHRRRSRTAVPDPAARVDGQEDDLGNGGGAPRDRERLLPLEGDRQEPHHFDAHRGPNIRGPYETARFILEFCTFGRPQRALTRRSPRAADIIVEQIVCETDDGCELALVSPRCGSNGRTTERNRTRSEVRSAGRCPSRIG